MASEKKRRSAAARELSRKFVSRGGKARAAALSPERRSDIAAAAAAARWKRPPRIRVAFDDHRAPDWRLDGGLRPILLSTEVQHPQRGRWAGETLAALESTRSTNPKFIDLFPEPPAWIDLGGLEALVRDFLRGWVQGDTGPGTYLVREKDGEWYQESMDVGAGKRGDEA